MADLKISQMTDGGTFQVGDYFAGVRAGVNYKITLGSAAAYTVGTGAGQIPTNDDLGALATLDSVGANEIDAGAVGSSELATDSVTTIKVLDKNITYAKMQDISATARILARKSSGAGVTEEATLSEILDFIGSAAQGDILYRGASGWARLGFGTANYVLKTNGTGQNPSYDAVDNLVTVDNGIQDFRLSLTTGVAVTTADVTGASAQTIYAVPYKGNRIALYNGTKWVQYTSAQFSLALGTLTATRPYDVFCYQNAGVPTLEFLAWTNGTTRATNLAYQDGVLVKSGDATRRYLGTFYTVNTTQTEDSVANRFLWNYYHRARRGMSRAETTATWAYSTNTLRQANASTSNQLNFVIGVAEDTVEAQCSANAVGSGTTLRGVIVGIGLNSTTTNSAQVQVKGFSTTVAPVPSLAAYNGVPAAGINYLAWLEAGAGADTQTWQGAGTGGGGPTGKSGIWGSVMA